MTIPNYYVIRKNALDDFNTLWGHLGFRSENERTFSLQASLSEESDKYFLSVDMPGIKEEDVSIEFQDGLLVIHGERKKASSSGEILMDEVSRGKFRREFRFGNLVDTNEIKAELKDGILLLTLPKSTQTKAKVITINKLS